MAKSDHPESNVYVTKIYVSVYSCEVELSSCTQQNKYLLLVVTAQRYLRQATRANLSIEPPSPPSFVNLFLRRSTVTSICHEHIKTFLSFSHRMLPRCSSLWLPTRLPTRGAKNPLHPRLLLRNTARSCTGSRQLSISVRRPSHRNTTALYNRCRPSLRHMPKIMATSERGHAGGGHHHHHHDNTYLVSKDKNDAGVRITRIGLLVNFGMAVGKGVGGYVFHSQGKLVSRFCDGQG
jgi:hypothetical protein